MKSKLLFNCVPPALITMPSAPFSVLKSFLDAHQINCSIYYWNLKIAKLQKNFLWAQENDSLHEEYNSMLLFFNYLAIKMNDQSSYNKIKGRLMMIKPQFVGREKDLFDKHMLSYANQLDNTLDEVINEICSPDIPYYGFSANLYQWVASSIISSKIKTKYPQSKILLGGLGNKNAALKFIENFNQFDFALWGEGENALYSLIQELDNQTQKFDDIPNLIYRKGNNIAISPNRKVDFVDLSSIEVRPDYQDYFDQIKKCADISKSDCSILVEGSRGCHWNRCHFCFLNTGYKNRTKGLNQLIAEIRYNITQFQIYTFCFLDNDIINNDYKRFEDFLDRLIEIKLEYPDFKIRLAEIITKGIHQKIVKKMALAGFENVQIGYESPSDTLLKKIDKKNSFASNLLFLKFASIYKIHTNGANVIRGLFEETEEDILEGIINLHSLRFILQYNYFQHSLTSLAVNSASRYYKQFPKVKEWKRLQLFDYYLPKHYLLVEDDNIDIIDTLCTDINPLWSTFENTELYYLKNRFTYQLVSNGDMILYKEYFNNTSINELAFERNSLEWYILRKTNCLVYTYEDLLKDMRSELTSLTFTDVEVIEIIKDLKEEKLIYTSKDYSEIVSIIDVKGIL